MTARIVHLSGINEIIKRDGRRASFDLSKIAQAMRKAFFSVNELTNDEYCAKLAQEVMEEIYFRFNYSPGVEQVQDIVEEVLIKNNHAQVAKAYILYRSERSRVREMNTRLMQVYEDITFNDSKDSEHKRENANVNCDTAMGTMLKYGAEGAKQFFQMFVLKPDHARAHNDGEIHIHDLEFLTMTATCCQIDLIKLFTDGFGTGHGFLREPKDILSYSALACIAIQSNQNDQHGGQSIANFDYGLAIGVRKTFVKRYRLNLLKFFEVNETDISESDIAQLSDAAIAAGGVLRMGLMADYLIHEAAEYAAKGFEDSLIARAQAFACKHAEKETDRASFQAMEALVHNLNTMHSRAGAQTPFSSINYGLDTSPEGRMIIKNVLLALENGLGGGETPIFPIHIFRVKSGITLNEGDPNYDLFKLACRVSARRLYPNFAFQDAPFNLQYYEQGRPETEIAYMGCRTRVMGNAFDPTRPSTFGRGNLSYTSINLPRIGICAKGDLNWFYRELDKKISLVVDQLLERFAIQCRKKVRNFPFLMGQGVWLDSENLGQEDEIAEILKHGTLTIGFIGLAECLIALTGKHHGECEQAQALGLEIIGFMRRRMDDEAQKRQLNFSLIATPGEGLSGRFVRIDREVFGEIAGITDKEYYTNSFHVPVSYNLPAAQKIDIEAPYHALTNAGHITYVELDGEAVKNLSAFEKIIRYMAQSGMGYGSINHPVDRDTVCGYSGPIGDTCPGCGRSEGDIPFDRIRRITGYLAGTLERFNDAKRAEVRDRTRHDFNEIAEG
ncbi:MAG: anaerobic ribonucleoside triphosphate reductase [Defluviitaleaceae bacterium]|nr:anaerobic ribonucleoside triphosphate reductase [Defluviitaleaceae bacterium]